ncbi:MAG: indolepyruvate ferredoxin oxidoreductase family protein [Fimbriimonadaceae bacterium]|nr:indolepyruvate ferredoxin oxidoreductase family protein [Alphaproteobacteria bacterium]
MNMGIKGFGLDDKYTADSGRVYLTGVQALVRLPLDLARLDRANKLDTAGYISGYRGSPLSGYDTELGRAGRHLAANGIVFQPGVNEELAATAVWGTQKTGLHPNAKHQGVFGIWYGKSPGVDRTGDVFKHANHTGTAKYGGVLAIAGDDPLAKSSSLPNQSDYAFVDAEIPVLVPADLQDLLDLALHGIALSRYSGAWCGLIAYTDILDSSGVINVDPARLSFKLPKEDQNPRRARELNCEMDIGNRFDTEVLTRGLRLPGAKAYARANRLDYHAFGASNPRYGIVVAGRAYRDLMQAFKLFGIDDATAKDIGLGVFKVSMVWPIEPEGLRSFATGAEKVLVVEHKRALVEPQFKEQAYHWPESKRPEIWGKTDPKGKPLLADVSELSAYDLGDALLRFLPKTKINSGIRSVLKKFKSHLERAEKAATDVLRSPFFCSGCPHNSSTVAPDGSRVMGGVGCHLMTATMDRSTDGVCHMGGEGVMWLGQVPFTDTKHIFSNIGDGTYYHSGILAIRAAVAAKAPITYKLLYNDAVAMTGGQPVEGPLSVPQVTRQLEAEGVQKIVVVTDDPDVYQAPGILAPNVPVYHRRDIIRVQEELREYPGVSVLIFDQGCATEKRRKRKRGIIAPAIERTFINPRVCEGCGDCSVKSNCISVEPLETPFGTKRQINQSSCNMDYSCIEGFCPSFVTIEGVEVRQSSGSGVDIEALASGLPMPELGSLEKTHNILFTGVGGQGVSTSSAVLAMAAHMDGSQGATLDMTGMAQKGGPVMSHIRVTRRDPSAERSMYGSRVPTGDLDVLLGGDMIVAAGQDVLEMCDTNKSIAILNDKVATTAEFVLKQRQSADSNVLRETIKSCVKEVYSADFAELALRLLSDSIYANMMLIGFAWQRGLVPISDRAIEDAILLNGVSVKANRLAFHAGRIAAHDIGLLEIDIARLPEISEIPLDERIAFLEDELAAYQNASYRDTFTGFIKVVRARESSFKRLEKFTRTVAENLYKLMAYKDEYEVARLYADPEFSARIAQQFTGNGKFTVHLAPPLLARKNPETGRIEKMKFGPWILTAFKVLARLKGLRGTMFDVFGYTEERRTERALIADYRALIERLLRELDAGNYDLAVEIANWPDKVRGYGHVKEGKLANARANLARLMARWPASKAKANPAAAHQAAE